MLRAAVLIALCVLAVALPASALAQGGGAFGPLPRAAPEPTATPTPSPTAVEEGASRAVLYVIGAGLLVLLAGIGWYITRDARRALPAGAESPRPRDAGPHRHPRQTKSRSRAKAKAQRVARRRNR